MKSLINMRAWAMMLMLMFLSGTSAWADVDDYILSVRNVLHTTNTIDFDLYLLDADDTQTFEYASLQMGLLLNSSIYGAGVLTVSYSNTGSGLDIDQQFVGSADVVGSLPGYSGQTLIRLAPNSIPPVPPGAGSGTAISSSVNGTLLAHFTITSSVDFTPYTTPNFIFCASSDVSPLYPTILSSYINGNATSLVVIPGVNAIVDGNPLLNATTKTLTLTSVLLEGIYVGAGIMRQAAGESGPQWPAGIADHITVELHSSSSYATIIYSASEVELTTSGTAAVTVPSEHSGSYYITVKHRNSVETTTATAVSFLGPTVNYSFNLQSSAFGGNLGSSGDGRFLIFTGDVNQDGSVDTQDYLGVDNDASNYLTGYLVTDVDGNGSVDTNDYLFIDNNNYEYVGTIHP